MNYMETYERWLNDDFIDEKTKEELKSIKNNTEEIQDRFYKNLEFGTAGLRGKLGAGTNRMNVYNISKVTQGIADFIKEKGQDYMNRGVAIAYDVRHFSKEFSKTAALVLAANGIKSYLFEDIRPTPELSFTIRKLHTAAGIIITASHNPKEYNGYKVYWEDGAQVLSSIADPMTEKINKINSFKDVKIMDEKDALDKGLLNIIGKEIDDEYIEKVKELSIRNDIDKDIKVVYSPLNGTGNIPVRRVLKERGFTNIIVVPEQENPDPDFTTVGYPNPEDTKAFKYAENLGKKVGADLLIATDPDCDRLAIEVKDKNGEYIAFNGNQTGAILIKYIVEGMNDKGTLPKNAAIVKSIVTGDLGKVIAEKYGVTTFEALTGFKNICGRIPKFEATGKYQFIFGYEESIGYNASTFVRDKDAVSSSMLLCEAAGYYKSIGKTLIDVLSEAFKEYGYYKEKQISLVLEGIEGQERISRMMKEYRKSYPTEIGTMKLKECIDFIDGYKDIGASNVLKFYLDDGSWYAVRPSGTEPKIKIYLYTKADTPSKSEENLKVMEEVIIGKLNSIE
ncbi:phosphoglucomutase [Clostridium novyi A str. 4552]|uniref:Phosphoglucomutase n=1 Tax=Clostridium novyi A str. 4552 TaxID=1444289 RepID=A0A0A0IBT4_CLONO|nr:phospho-sugar mutase [Clostridium novyi]KGM97998.1 phosphoglucomutase [Clostridium novyi A str. 4552]